MDKHGFIIIACFKCGAKNRVRSYDEGQIPVCAKCKTELVGREENEVHSRYGKMEDAFHNLPKFGLRGEK